MKFPSMEEALAEAERTLAIQKAPRRKESPDNLFFNTARGQMVRSMLTFYVYQHMTCERHVEAYIADDPSMLCPEADKEILERIRTDPRSTKNRITFGHFGIGIETARAFLKPMIPEAHTWYNEAGNSDINVIRDFDQLWRDFLENRVTHFFRDSSTGKRCWAEWSGRRHPYGPEPVPNIGLLTGEGAWVKPGPFPLYMREERLAICKGRCELCGVQIDLKSADGDHIFFQAGGGLNHPNNLQMTCKKCNALKGDRHVNDYRRTCLNCRPRE